MVTLKDIAAANGGMVPAVATLIQQYSEVEVVALLAELEIPEPMARDMIAIESGQSLVQVAWTESDRADAASQPDTPASPLDLEADLSELVLAAAQPIIDEHVGSIQSAVDGSTDYATLNAKLPALYDEMPRQPLVDAIAEAFIRANLIGRLQVTTEAEEPPEGTQARTDAPRPAYLRQNFAEAMEYLRRKVNIPTETWRSLTAEQHDVAYTIAGLTDANLLEDVRWLIEHSEAEGVGFDEFKRMFNRLISRKGWRPGEHPEAGEEDWRLKVAFETPIRRAISAGRNQQIKAIVDNPTGLKKMPGRMWLHTSTAERYLREYPNARLNHLALHRKVFPADDPFWKIAAPSCGYLCRCTSVLIPSWKMERDGLTMSTPPDPLTIAEPGFQKSAGLLDGEEQQAAARSVLPRLSPDIRRRVTADFKKKGIL